MTPDMTCARALSRTGLVVTLAILVASCGADRSPTTAARATLNLSPRGVLSVQVGVPVQLQVTSTPPQPMSALRWGSSAPDLVAVSDSGVILARAAATVQISVWLARDSAVRDSLWVVTLNADSR